MGKLFKKTLGLLIVLFGGIALFTSLYSSWSLYVHMESEYRWRGTAIARSLSEIGMDILDKRSSVTDAIFNQYLESPGVVYIVVRDANGQIKYHTFQGAVPRILSQVNPTGRTMVNRMYLRDFGQVLDIQHSMIGLQRGSVQVGMDLEWVKRMAWRAFLVQQFIIFVIFIITIFVAAVIVRRLASPLSDLANYAEALSHHDFREPSLHQRQILQIAKTNTDEVGHLAKAIAQMENQLIAYIRNLKETMMAKEKIESELNVAREIQMNMVPRDFPLFPSHPELNIHSYIEPAKAVGGDFYDFVLSENKQKLAFSIGDVSGKGIPAALFMAITTTLIKAASAQFDDPARVVSTVNRKLCRENKSGLFVTVFYGVLDLKTGILDYCVGGHNPPYLVSTEVATIPTTPGLPMGIDENAEYCSQRAQLQPNDTLFLFTDGVTECRNRRGEFFEDAGIERLLAQYKTAASEVMCEAVVSALEEFSRGAAQSDDITMAAIKWRPELETV